MLPRLRLPGAGLHPAATLAIAALSFGGAASLGGSGFLAVYLTGLRLGGARIPGRRTVGAFHDGLEHLRLRRDAPGALVFLEDGRYAITGRQAAIGGRDDVMRWALRRIAGADGGEERSWLQTALAGLAGDRRD